MLVANICFAHLHTNAIVITIHGLHYVTAIVSIFVTLNLFINKCFSFVGEEARGDNFTNMRYRFQKSHLVSRRGSDTYLSPQSKQDVFTVRHIGTLAADEISCR